MDNKVGKQWKRLIAALFILLVASCVSWYLSRNAYEAKMIEVQGELLQQSLFDSSALQRTLGTNLAVLRAMKSFVAISGHVDRQSFSNFAKRLQSERSHFQAIEWIPLVTSDEREKFEQLAQEDGFRDFQFTERATQGTMVRRSDQDTYYPVYYVEPLKGNELAVGFDLASDDTRRVALERARESGEAVASARITLVQEQQIQHVFLFFVPVFGDPSSESNVDRPEDNFLGYILGVVRVGDLVEASLHSVDPAAISIVLRDLDAPTDNSILYVNSSIPELETLAGSNPLARRNMFSIGGRQWSLEHRFTDEYFKTRMGFLHSIILAIGIVLSLTLSTYLFDILGREESTKILVANRTLELHTSEAGHRNTILQLREMNRHKSKFLSSMSHELRTPLNAILGFGDLLSSQGFGLLNEKQTR
ncbi:MAG: CHASE domain-containing protein, partial [Candidatus Hydrogenedentota bacterium]